MMALAHRWILLAVACLSIGCQPSDGFSSQNGMQSILHPFAMPGPQQEDRMQWALKMADEAEDEGEPTSTAFPRPPMFEPYIPEELSRDLSETRRQVFLYENEIRMIREQLLMKQKEYEEAEQNWREDKSSLLSKITEFTSLLSQRDEENDARAKREKEYQSKQKELEGEIRGLISQLKTVQGKYEKEAAAATELRKSLEETSDRLEYDQMEYEKSKASLEAAIALERSNLRKLETQMKNNDESYERTRQELISKIEEEEKKLKRAKEKWESSEKAMKQQEQELREKIISQQQVIDQGKKDMDSQRVLFNEEKAELRELINEEKRQVEETKKLLRDEQNRAAKMKADLENVIATEQKKLADLQAELVREQERFSKEKEALEENLREEKQRLLDIEAQLASERENAQKEKERLENEISEEIRIRKLKKRQMNERYEKIRKEMTDLWEGAKRDARRNEKKLVTKYEEKLAVVNGRLSSLEAELERSSLSNKDLEARVSELKSVSTNLQTDLEVLQRTVVAKNSLIEEKAALIDSYEGSYRQLAKLSLKLTGRRIRKAGSAVKRVFSRRKGKGKS